MYSCETETEQKEKEAGTTTCENIYLFNLYSQIFLQDSCNDADESDGTNNTGFVLRKWNIVSAVSFANALGNNDYKFCTLD
jgi:hypothetical protein